MYGFNQFDCRVCPPIGSRLSGLSQLYDLAHEESRGLKFREDSERAAFWTPCKVGHQSLWWAELFWDKHSYDVTGGPELERMLSSSLSRSGL